MRVYICKTQSAGSGNGPVFSIELFACNGRMIVLLVDDERDESTISPLPTKSISNALKKRKEGDVTDRVLLECH